MYMYFDNVWYAYISGGQTPSQDGVVHARMISLLSCVPLILKGKPCILHNFWPLWDNLMIYGSYSRCMNGYSPLLPEEIISLEWT